MVSGIVYADIAGRIDVELAKLRVELGDGLERFNRMVAEQAVPAVVPKRKVAAAR